MSGDLCKLADERRAPGRGIHTRKSTGETHFNHSRSYVRYTILENE